MLRLFSLVLYLLAGMFVAFIESVGDHTLIGFRVLVVRVTHLLILLG